MTYTMREDSPAYGYHRCPFGSVCFFSEHDGNGEMCRWKGDDPDWLSGDETCMWARDRPVKSIFNNSDESTGLTGVAYYRGRDFTPLGNDLLRPAERQRTGCTAQRNQGNLAGTYAPLSHKWIDRC